MWKKNWSLTGMSLAAIVFYAVCGLLLLLLPTEALAIANYAIAALLLVMGVVCVIGYFRGSVIIGSVRLPAGGGTGTGDAGHRYVLLSYPAGEPAARDLGRVPADRRFRQDPVCR